MQKRKGDTQQISLNSTRVHTLDQLVKEFKIDTRLWSVERFTANKRSCKSDEELYHVRAWLCRNQSAEIANEELERFKRGMAKYSPRPVPINRKRHVSGNIAELNIPDIHFGKLAWKRETGESYDLTIALDRYSDAIDILLSRISSFHLDEIVLVVGNDMFHFDSRSGTTTAGTQQDADTRYHKLFSLVAELITGKIEDLRRIAPVRVVVVSGNHDELSAWHLGHSLQCWFRHYTDVAIDNEPTARKYYQHGNVMLMWAHGNKGKRPDYPLQMATERPEMWGATKYREAHTGHLHTERMNEYHGVKVRIFPALCGTDAWHADNGYTGNLKQAEAFVWNKDEGLVSIAVYTAPDSKPRPRLQIVGGKKAA